MKFVKRLDIILIFALIITAVAIHFFYQESKNELSSQSAHIYHDGILVKTIDLTEQKNYTFSIEQVPEVIFHVFADGSIKFEQSNCPDKVCINMGSIRSVGESAVCLPNNLILKITGDDAKQKADIFIG